VNPFDLKSALLAKHAQHVVLIHFPIALFLAGALLDMAAHWTKKPALATAAHYNLKLAAFCSVPAVITGVLAWQLQFEGQRLKGTLLLHLIFGLGSAVLIWIVWWVHARATRTPERTLPAYRLPLEAIAVTVVAMTAHLGGFLSGVN
jgi:uncharacterized membrane protein